MNIKPINVILACLLAISLAACSQTSQQPEVLPPTAAVPDTVPVQSPLYTDGLSAEDVILYFNEVCLDAEMSNGGDASRLQKWTAPIYYRLNGQHN